MRSNDRSKGWRNKALSAAALLVAGGLWFYFFHERDANRAARKMIHGWLQSTSVHQGNEDYIDDLIARHHPAAFAETYTPGGRRRAARFDRARYEYLVLTGMAQDADGDGKRHVARAIREVYAARQHATPR